MDAGSCRFIHWDAFAAGTASRWRWTLLIVGATLLLCLTVLVSYLTRNFVKRECAIMFAAALQEGTDESFEGTRCQHLPIGGLNSVLCILQNGCGCGVVVDL